MPLFDRSGRYPTLTGAGAVLLADARGIVSGVNSMKARARGMSEGLEPELSVVVDVFMPIEAITSAAKEFRVKFPGTPLRLYVEALGGVFQPLLDGRASLEIAGALPLMPSAIMSEALTEFKLVFVAAQDHPLASYKGSIPKTELARHVQLVLTDRSTLSASREFGVMSPSTWRLADLFAKHAFLLNGLGFGGMPLHTVRLDLKSGKLVEWISRASPERPHVADARRLSNKCAAGSRGALAHRAAENLSEPIVLDHDDFGSNRSKVINVINSNKSERDSREKPVSTFSRAALERHLKLFPLDHQIP